MRRSLFFASAIVGVVVALAAGCGLFPNLGDLSGSDGGPSDDATTSDAAPDVAVVDSGSDTAIPADSGSDGAACSCTNLVSAYRFSDGTNLGQDFFGHNDMTTVIGAPTRSTITPPGLSGYSIQLNGSSSVCIDTGFTFDSTADHTLCWWSRPSALADSTNQFAQKCSYDTWTASSGVDYLWRINNCNGGTAADFVVPNVYAAGQWTQICQTYSAANLKRSIVVNGQTTQKATQIDTVPILEPSSGLPWCIGSWGAGGYWTGLIYLPMWFDRVLTDTEIQQVYANACCLP